MSSGGQLQRVSTVEALVDVLRRRILSGELAPGTQLREVELATEFSVGRHSLRAALQALAHEGVLRHEPNRGVFVPVLLREDVEDLFLLRTAIETEVVRLIVQRGIPVPAAVAAVERMEALTGDEPWDEVIELDLGFHHALVDAVASPRVGKTFTSLLAEMRLLLAQMQGLYQRPEKIGIGEEHRAVIDAILSRRPAHAAAVMREHMDVGVRDILSAIGSDESRSGNGRVARRR